MLHLYGDYVKHVSRHTQCFLTEPISHGLCTAHNAQRSAIKCVTDRKLCASTCCDNMAALILMPWNANILLNITMNSNLDFLISGNVYWRISHVTRALNIWSNWNSDIIDILSDLNCFTTRNGETKIIQVPHTYNQRANNVSCYSGRPRQVDK